MISGTWLRSPMSSLAVTFTTDVSIFFSLFSFILAWTFISLQIIEFQIMGLSINDSFYSCVFFFLTGFHFFHLVLGLLLISLFYWSSSFSSLILISSSKDYILHIIFYFHLTARKLFDEMILFIHSYYIIDLLLKWKMNK